MKIFPERAEGSEQRAAILATAALARLYMVLPQEGPGTRGLNVNPSSSFRVQKVCTSLELRGQSR
jgi:hypothetical protein